MMQRFKNRKISIMKPGVLSYKADPDAVFAAFYPLNHGGPLSHVWLRGLYAELPADYA